MCLKEYQDIKIFVKGEKFRTTYYPHFEVDYRGMLKAKFSFDLSILEGRLPADVTLYVVDWAQRNCSLLKSEWDSILNKKHIQ
jgi:hypothetical protein